MGRRLGFLVVGAWLVGCVDGGSTTVDDVDDTDPAVTDTDGTEDTDAAGDTDEDPVADVGVVYHRDVRPLIDRHCIGCHSPGGVAPLDMTYQADAWDGATPAWAFAAVGAVASGTMPPWPFDDDCHDVQGSRSLSDDDLALFAAWAENDFAEGNPAFYEAPAAGDVQALRPADIGPADFVLRSDEAHLADTENPDEYRCFVLDLPTDQDRWIRGIEVVPDEVPVVHHAIVYQYLPAQSAEIAEVLRRDAEDEGPGYDCWGNPGADTVMAWAPGQTGEFLPDGVGRLAAEGAVWILQIHYNTLGRDAADVQGDRTAVHVWTWDDDEKPAKARINIPVPNSDLVIPAGDPAVVQTMEADLSWLGAVTGLVDVHVVGTMGHMHQLGTSISLDLQYPNRTDCLLDVPDWDFGWQMSYVYPEAAWVKPGGNAKLVLTCTYDNSAANQIVVNGEQLEPRDVTWGEGTRDEMCLAYLQLQLPRSWLDVVLSLL